MDEPSREAPRSAEQVEVPLVSLGYVPGRRPAVLELDMGDGVILYDDGSGLVHHLNPSASIIWQLCEGEATVGELAADIAEAYRQDRSRVEEQVARAVAELDALGLVEDVLETVSR